MWKWLRSWFAWRFSLRRLVVATVFLGAVVGLSVCGPEVQIPTRRNRAVVTTLGWPLPVYSGTRKWDAACDVLLEPLTHEQYCQWEWMPWTHQTYRLLNSDSFEWLCSDRFWSMRATASGTYIILTVCLVIDALFALTVLALILFLQIPRRKVAAKVE